MHRNLRTFCVSAQRGTGFRLCYVNDFYCLFLANHGDADKCSQWSSVLKHPEGSVCLDCIAISCLFLLFGIHSHAMFELVFLQL